MKTLLKLKILACAVALLVVWQATKPLMVVKSSPSPDLRLRISASKNTYAVGEAVSLRVELHNTGDRKAFFYHKLEMAEPGISELKFAVTDDKGRTMPSAYIHIQRLAQPTAIERDFNRAVTEEWIAVSPGYFYGTSVELDSSLNAFLGKAGQYCIRAAYIARGMDSTLYYNRLSLEPDRIATLPYASWKGTEESNSVCIEITEAQAKKKR